MDERVGLRGFVHPAFVEIFCKLTVCHHEFQLHERGDVAVDLHDDRVRPVRILGIVAEVGLTLLVAHSVLARVGVDVVAYGRRYAREKERQTPDAVLRDVDVFALGHAVKEIGVEKLAEVLLAVHVGQPIVFGRADIQQCRFGKRNRHFVKDKKYYQLLDLAVQTRRNAVLLEVHVILLIVGNRILAPNSCHIKTLCENFRAAQRVVMRLRRVHKAAAGCRCERRYRFAQSCEAVVCRVRCAAAKNEPRQKYADQEKKHDKCAIDGD